MQVIRRFGVAAWGSKIGTTLAIYGADTSPLFNTLSLMKLDLSILDILFNSPVTNPMI